MTWPRIGWKWPMVSMGFQKAREIWIVVRYAHGGEWYLKCVEYCVAVSPLKRQ